ncbi:MAG TPA: hypothetical protein VKA55_00495 [Gammaproteobacteria bacterium]|nr:hypothetical protein [Gammaproteobacteria bacterium]
MAGNSDRPGGGIHLKEIRDLAERFSGDQIEGCIHHQLDAGSNPCAPDTGSEQAMNVLAKAEYVRGLMDEQGYSLSQAIRELGRRIRRVQQFGEGEAGQSGPGDAQG